MSDAEKIKELSKELKAKEAEIKNLNQQLNCMKKMLFGQKSEKTSVIIENPEQLSFFDEAENHGDRNATVEESEVISSYKRKRKRTRDELLKDLPAYSLWVVGCCATTPTNYGQNERSYR